LILALSFAKLLVEIDADLVLSVLGTQIRRSEIGQDRRRRLLARLPPRQREAVYLRYHADLPFDEVADVMGVTAGAARGYVTRAVASLRSALIDWQEAG